MNMKRLKLFFTALLLFSFGVVFAQSDYNCREFKRAINAKTRTLTGQPGENYKTNFAEYKINVSFDTQNNKLEGQEYVVYHVNESRLSVAGKIVMNLYRNIYKKGTPRIRACNVEDITDEGVEILEVSKVISDTEKKELKFSENGTQIVISCGGVNEGSTITLFVKWRTRIAENTHLRGGKYGNDSWFVPYFFPQIAVLDDVFGWDNVQHSGNEEFVFERSNYDVNIQTTGKKVIWATGELVNKNEIFSKEILDNWNRALKSDSKVDIISSQNLSRALKNEKNTWHFKADSVPDFVFACSDEMLWSGASVLLKGNKKRTFVSSVFFHNGFSRTIDMTRKTLEYLSAERPGVPYPYPHLTVFEGSGGMEFPMMINEDFDNDYDSDFFTTSHEVTHSYFPFLTGMYQNRFGFMDEGLTMYVPQYFQNKLFKHRNIIESAVRNTEYTQTMSENTPIITPSYSQTHLWVFTVNSYYKPQLAYTYLEDIVGEKVMDNILNTFTTTWLGKHPLPYDFFNMCEKISGVDLKYFFKSWFFSVDVPDLAIAQVKDKTISIENKGGLMVPIYLKVNYQDGTSETIERNALCWNASNNMVNMTVSKAISSVELGNSQIPDMDSKDNVWTK